MTHTRRDFLAHTTATGALATLGLTRMASAAQPTQGPTRAKNLIFMVSDGVGLGALKLGDDYSRSTRGDGLAWMELARSSAMSLLETDPAEPRVTDSAAAASAWSIGRRVNNGAISVTPDGEAHTPFLVRAKAAGKAIGVVSTYNITDASPAAFYANALRRGDAETIADQLARLAPRVTLGGGARRFNEERLARWDRPRTVGDKEQLVAAPFDDRPLVGLFTPGPMTYMLEKPANEPTVADLTRAALARLAASPAGFAAVIENELTDDGGHTCDAAALVTELLAFDDAVRVALDFTRQRDDTLLVVISDHDNGAPGLIYGYEDRLANLGKITRSQTWMRRRIQRMQPEDRTAEAIGRVIEEATTYKPTPTQLRLLERWAHKEPRKEAGADLFSAREQSGAPLGSALSEFHGVGFSSPHHTPTPILAAATGPGAERMPAFGHQTDIHGVIANALGL